MRLIACTPRLTPPSLWRQWRETSRASWPWWPMPSWLGRPSCQWQTNVWSLPWLVLNCELEWGRGESVTRRGMVVFSRISRSSACLLPPSSCLLVGPPRLHYLTCRSIGSTAIMLRFRLSPAFRRIGGRCKINTLAMHLIY